MGHPLSYNPSSVPTIAGAENIHHPSVILIAPTTFLLRGFPPVLATVGTCTIHGITSETVFEIKGNGFNICHALKVVPEPTAEVIETTSDVPE
jgi:hypothetical protein